MAKNFSTSRSLLRTLGAGGQLLRQREMAKGARGSGSNQHQVRSHDTTAPPLSDLGISKQQSSNWQKMAAVPDECSKTAELSCNGCKYKQRPQIVPLNRW